MSAARKTPHDASEAIYRMDTLPPPAGEHDAYSAETKIGPMARAHVEALMAKAQAEENSSMPPPISTTRGLSIPKAARVPTIRPPASEPAIQRMYDEVAEGDLLDPTALFGAPSTSPCAGNTLRLGDAMVRSIIDEVDSRRLAALPLRSDAEWTKAPTLIAISVAPVPP